MEVGSSLNVSVVITAHAAHNIPEVIIREHYIAIAILRQSVSTNFVALTQMFFSHPPLCPAMTDNPVGELVLWDVASDGFAFR